MAGWLPSFTADLELDSRSLLGYCVYFHALLCSGHGLKLSGVP